MTYILFVLGFFALVKGADVLVDGASSLAKRFGVSILVIGLTIVAFGTSAPELVVSVLASLDGHNDLAIGNIVGSNISNVLLMLGICAFIAPLVVKRQTVMREIPFAILSIVLLAIFVLDSIINGASQNMLSRTEGITLLSLFAIFIYYTFIVSRNGKDEENEIEDMSVAKSLIFIALGLVGLTLGGKWIVDGAVEIARLFGMTEALIGLTIVAIGTSLPELAASAVATYKGKTDLAIGNVVGSNIFNVFLVLGINSSIANIPYNPLMNTDMAVAIGSIVLLFVFVLFSKGHKLNKWQGGVFVILYILYIIYLVYRG